MAERSVYRLTFPNGMVYIGSTSDTKKRWANNGSGYKGQAVYEAIKDFGWENVKKEVVLTLKSDELLVRKVECALIKEFGKKCYNKMSSVEYHRGKRPPSHGVVKHFWEIDGVVRPAKDWCADYGVYLSHALSRMERHGLTPKEALTFPPLPKGSRKGNAAEEYWKSRGYFPGTDKTSRVV